MFLNLQKNHKVIPTIISQYVRTGEAAPLPFFKVVLGTPCFFIFHHML